MNSRRYILLPRIGFRDKTMAAIRSGRGHRLSVSSHKHLPDVAGRSDIEVVEILGPDDGPRLLDMSIDTARGIRRESGDFILAPVRKYRPAIRPLVSPRSRGLFDSQSTSTTVKVRIVDEDNEPIREAVAVVITNRLTMEGFRRTSGASGRMTWKFPGNQARADELYIYPPPGYWGRFESNVGFSPSNVFELQKIDATSFPSALTDCGIKQSKNKGKDVTVGVIDTGVCEHHALHVNGGENTTEDGQPKSDFADVQYHGTHVAGIIGANGVDGVSGISPNVRLRSYRVFESGKRTSDTVAIMRAIYKGVEDGCDILNLSLGGGPSDLALSNAIGYAADSGTLCVVACGNGGHRPVSYPAWYKRAIAVSAYGRRGSFPDDSVEVGDIKEPYGDKGIFFAAFSNAGYEVDLIGPGVGIVSCAPGGAYAVMSGTSMACPAVSGVAACLLSDHKDIRRMNRDIERTLAIGRLLRAHAIDCGLPAQFQGHGRCSV